MATRPPVSESQAERHRLAQASLASTAAAATRAAWEHFFDLADLSRSASRLIVAVESVARNYGRASAAAALTDYRNQRRAAGVTGKPPIHMPILVAHRDAVLTVEHILTPLYGTPTPPQVNAASESLASSVERLVLDQSRTALIQAVHDDPAAKGWSRVTEPGACYFCAMQASRGAVYRSRETADFRAHTKQPNGSGGTCQCHVEPFFHKYEPTAQARQWQADWNNLKDKLGHTPSIIEWRQAFEGREITPSNSRPHDSKSHGGSSRSNYDLRKTTDQIDRAMTTDQITSLIGQLERAQAKHSLDATTRRLAQLRAELARR